MRFMPELRQLYPSISKYYVIEYDDDDGKSETRTDIRWSLSVPDSVDWQSVKLQRATNNFFKLFIIHFILLLT